MDKVWQVYLWQNEVLNLVLPGAFWITSQCLCQQEHASGFIHCFDTAYFHFKHTSFLSYRLVSHFFTNHTHLKFATIVHAYLTEHEFTNKFILHFFYDYSLQCDVNITATSKNAAEEYQNEMKHLFKTVCWTLTLMVTSKLFTLWPTSEVLVEDTPTWFAKKLMLICKKELVNWPKKNWKELSKSCKTQFNTKFQLGFWTDKKMSTMVKTTTTWPTTWNPNWEMIWKD